MLGSLRLHNYLPVWALFSHPPVAISHASWSDPAVLPRYRALTAGRTARRHRRTGGEVPDRAHTSCAGTGGTLGPLLPHGHQPLNRQDSLPLLSVFSWDKTSEFIFQSFDLRVWRPTDKIDELHISTFSIYLFNGESLRNSFYKI